MPCESSSHHYRPFPDSYRLYCRRCGETIDPLFTHKRSQPERSFAPVSIPIPEGVNDVDAVDPDLDGAQKIIAERTALDELESRTREILMNEGVGGKLAEDIVREVLDFGPGVNFDVVQEQVRAIAQDQAPPSNAADDIIRGSVTD